MTILETIQRACKTKGVDKKYAERIEKAFKVKKAEGVETAVDSFKENILPGIVEAEEAGKKSSQADVEKAAVKAFREKHNLGEDGKPIEKKEPDTSKVDPAIKELIENQNKQIEKLTEMVTGNIKDVSTAEKTATATKLITGAKLPEGWVSRIDLNSETSIEDQVEALKEEYTGIQQGAITEKVEKGEFTPAFQQPKERSEKEWEELMNKDDSSSNTGVVDLGIE